MPRQFANSNLYDVIKTQGNVSITPSETLTDPVGKLRVSNPQALIDTDFEYSTQSTKWETINLLNNRPSAFYDVTAPLNITGVSASTTTITATLGVSLTGTYSQTLTAVTLTVSAHAVQVGQRIYVDYTSGSGVDEFVTVTGVTATTISFTSATSIASTSGNVSVYLPPPLNGPIFVQGTTQTVANGWFLVNATPTGSTFTYIVPTTAGSGSIYDSTKTYIYNANFYTGSAIPVSASAGAAFVASTTTVTCTTTNAHGLTVGDAIFVIGTTAATSGPPNGSWIVQTTPTVNTFTFTVLTAPSGAITATAGATSTLYPRPYGSVVHRPFDGGVAFSTGYPYTGNQLIRQTRRYFRYQSGKGIQFSTGTCLKPAFFLDSITSSGTTVTVTTKTPHSINIGAYVIVSGSTDSAYNGTFIVTGAPTDLTFTYTANATPTATPAPGFPLNVSPQSWYGSKSRTGLFDEQNGFFFEFDGQTLYAVKRSSTTQISGTVATTNGSTTVTGTNTLFSTQLAPGNYIVIRGMSYVVQSISSDTSMNIYPEYRGTTISGNCIVSKTIEEKYPQNLWNIDKCDGTGSTKFNLDLTKMQMFYIDYAWYGAGAIRFGFKDQFGTIIYCHRVPNSNRNTEAYMRSGNMCSRYEANTFAQYTNLAATLSSSNTTSVTVASTTGFPSSGTLVITAPGNTTSAIEYINYTGLTATTFTGLTRAVTNLTGPGGLTTGGGNGTAQTFTYSATAPIQVASFPAQFSSSLSHWGSAVIMDGKYDDDKSYIFQAGLNTPLSNLGANTSAAVLSIRIAPSVDSGITGLLGARDLINRMQLTLRQMDVVATGSAAIFRVELILNGRIGGTGAGTFAAAGGSSLAQVATHSTSGATTINGGESILSFFVYTPSVVQQDLILVRDLGNSILGGGTSTTVPTSVLNLYPDGPDVVTIKVTNVSAVTTNTIASRISWTEAQA
jgi:hypothetical protein